MEYGYFSPLCHFKMLTSHLETKAIGSLYRPVFLPPSLSFIRSIKSIACRPFRSLPVSPRSPFSHKMWHRRKCPLSLSLSLQIQSRQRKIFRPRRLSLYNDICPPPAGCHSSLPATPREMAFVTDCSPPAALPLPRRRRTRHSTPLPGSAAGGRRSARRRGVPLFTLA